MAHKWFVQRGDKQNGPLSVAQLKQLAGSGQLAPSDLVRREDMTDWKQAGSVKGLFQTESQSKSPPPVPEDAANKPSPPPVSTPSDSPASSPTQQSIGEKLKTVWTEFLGTAKAAKDLAAAQARRAKLTKFDLPKAYLALGKSIFESGKFKDEFAELFGDIEAAKAEVEKLGQPASPKSQGADLKDKVRAGAANLKAKGQQKAVSVKADSLYRQLGQKAFGSHGEAAGPQDFVASVVRCRDDVESLDREIARLSEVGKGTLLTPKRLIIGACVVGVLMLGFVVMVLGPTSSGKVGSAADLDDDPAFAKVRSGEGSFFPLEDPSMSRDRALQLMAVRVHAAITTNAQLRGVYIDPGVLNGQMKGAALALGCQRNPNLRALGEVRPDDTKTWSMDGKQYAISRYGNDVFFYFSSTPPKPPKLDSVQINGTSYMLNETLGQ